MYLHAVVQWRPPVDGGAISFFPKRATTPFRPAASDLQCLVMRAENVLNNINHFDQHKGSRITGASKTGENNYQYCQCQRWPGRITHLVHTGAHTRIHTNTHTHTHVCMCTPSTSLKQTYTPTCMFPPSLFVSGSSSKRLCCFGLNNGTSHSLENAQTVY